MVKVYLVVRLDWIDIVYFTCFHFSHTLLANNTLPRSQKSPGPTFSNFTQNDIMSVKFCLTTFCKKKLYTTKDLRLLDCSNLTIPTVPFNKTWFVMHQYLNYIWLYFSVHLHGLKWLFKSPLFLQAFKGSAIVGQKFWNWSQSIPQRTGE